MSPGKKHQQSRPTMQAVAERAGVSRATVSLILADRPGIVERFKPETVARVREAAEALDYRANIMALSLRVPQPSFFGLILRGTGAEDASSWHHQAFEGQFLAGALEASRILGLYPVLATLGSRDFEAAIRRARGVLDGGVFGSIIRTPRPELAEAVERQIENELPVVIAFPEDRAIFPTNCIDIDNLAAGRIAAELLLAAGRKDLLVIHDEDAPETPRLRNAAFIQEATTNDARVRELIVPGGMKSEESEWWLARQLAKLKPAGVYTACSITGVEVLMGCRAAGLIVPEQTALVGCNAALWRSPGAPTITSVDISWRRVGELAVHKMVELQETKEWRFESVCLPPKVHAGGTCPVGLVNEDGRMQAAG